MKKTITIIISIILIATALCGCGKSTKAKVDVTPDISNSEKIDVSDFKEVKASSENLDIYRQEVSKRTENAQGDDIFISDKDWDIIQLCWDESDILSKTNASVVSYSKLYKETSNYYYPVVFRDGESLIMWYTTDSGSVLLKGIYGHWNGSNYMGTAHCDAEGTIVESHSGSTLVYCQETGKVDYWSFGEKYETVNAPKGAEYCGLSFFEGYLFRVGSDVYALRTGFFEEGNQVEVIAHNVEYVIDASYDFGSDPWSQPLFLMKDGTVKCYISWEGDENAAPDDPSHLCDLQYEGGYHKGNK